MSGRLIVERRVAGVAQDRVAQSLQSEPRISACAAMPSALVG
jgi:hypothetical protein